MAESERSSRLESGHSSDWYFREADGEFHRFFFSQNLPLILAAS
jgi:hypothetical protein